MDVTLSIYISRLLGQPVPTKCPNAYLKKAGNAYAVLFAIRAPVPARATWRDRAPAPYYSKDHRRPGLKPPKCPAIVIALSE